MTFEGSEQADKKEGRAGCSSGTGLSFGLLRLQMT